MKLTSGTIMVYPYTCLIFIQNSKVEPSTMKKTTTIFLIFFIFITHIIFLCKHDIHRMLSIV